MENYWCVSVASSCSASTYSVPEVSVDLFAKMKSIWKNELKNWAYQRFFKYVHL